MGMGDRNRYTISQLCDELALSLSRSFPHTRTHIFKRIHVLYVLLLFFFALYIKPTKQMLYIIIILPMWSAITRSAR